MRGDVFWRIVLWAVVVYIAFVLLKWLVGFVWGLVHFAVVLAIVVGIIWLVMTLLGKKNQAY